MHLDTRKLLAETDEEAYETKFHDRYKKSAKFKINHLQIRCTWALELGDHGAMVPDGAMVLL